MTALLQVDDVCKRFGALAGGRELHVRRCRGRGPRHRRAERRGQDHAAQPDRRRPASRHRHDLARRRTTSPGCRRTRAAIAASVAPPRSRARSRGSPCSRTCSSAAPSAAEAGCRHHATRPPIAALEQAGMLDKANIVAGSLTLLDRKRLELARALPTQPTLLLLDEIAGGLTEGEVLELVETIKRDPGRWRVDRVDRAHRPRPAARRRSDGGGRRRSQADRGRPARGDVVERGPRGVPRRRPRRRRVLRGRRERAAAHRRPRCRATATSRRCSASNSSVAEAETVSIIGANGAGKSTLLKAIVGLVAADARRHPVRRAVDRVAAGAPSRRRRHRAGARGSAHLPVADRRGEHRHRRRRRPARARGTRRRCSTRSRCSRDC